jgi:ornithine cyclodeaminase
MKIITEEILVKLIKIHGFDNFLKDLMLALKEDFTRWNEFNIIPRPAMYVTDGVLELMPICDKNMYAFKYVNCHPKNITNGLMTVVATGQLSRVDSGYPILFSEMTLLTALRTATTTAIATDLISRKNSSILSIIGTGAQSEFLVSGIRMIRDIKEVRYFDIDPLAMDKFENNFKDKGLNLIRCCNSKEAVLGADIITTCTACREHVDVIKNDWIKSGVHINGIGGDSKGKTELELAILSRSQIAVEYLDQCMIEGEIQRLTNQDVRKYVCAELHELIKGEKVGRENNKQITIYDSVGIALEDYSVLRLVYNLSNQYGLGQELNFTPNLKDVKNLISMVDC